jgi:hypothetical protein
MSARGGGVEGRHGRNEKDWRGHDIRMRHDSLRLCIRTVRPGVALLCDGATRRVSIYRTKAEVSSNLNDREPVNGVNTPRMCRYLRRIIAGPYGRDVGRHTEKWPNRTTFDAGLEEASAYPSRPRPVALRHPPTTAPGVRRLGSPESFGHGAETFMQQSIDDASSIPQSFLSGKPATVRYFEPHAWVIRAARQIHAQPHYRSAHQSTCATPFRSGEARTSASLALHAVGEVRDTT